MSHTSKANVSTKIHSIFDYVEQDYRDGAEFYRYRKAVEAVLEKAKKPLSIREIHNAVGVVEPKDERRRFTMDVLEKLSVEESIGLVSRYWLTSKTFKGTKSGANTAQGWW